MNLEVGKGIRETFLIITYFLMDVISNKNVIRNCFINLSKNLY